ncbi:outer membrane protein [Microvirga sp. 2TAF3]|uniref:outer membrane protein n=1 Tax=Microvirga sp. 2TAF3 TaxID=3233014 RepID=UPI003F9A334B
MRLTIFAPVGLALGLAGPAAHAADLPPAPVLDDSDESVGSGWYLRGDIGAVDPITVRHGRDGGTAAVPPLVKARFDRGFVLGVGAGYQVSPWFRTDLTIDHRFGASYKGVRFGTDSGFALDRADFETTTFLANGYIDLPLWSGVTPYLGAGIGVGLNRFDNAERALVVAGASPSASMLLPSRTETVLAWALVGGIAIDLTANLKLDFGYRYSHLGAVRTQSDGTEPSIRARGISTHEFRIGARYMFD